MGTLLTDDGVDEGGPDRHSGSSRRWSFYRIGGALPHLRAPDGAQMNALPWDHHQNHLGRGRLRSGGRRPRRVAPSWDHGGICKRRGSGCDAACGRIRQRLPWVCVSAPGEPVAITAGTGLYEDPNGDLNVLHTQVVVDAYELTP